MTIDVKPILRLVPLAQAGALVGRNYKLATKKKRSSHDFLSAAADTIVGTALIQAESSFIG